MNDKKAKALRKQAMDASSTGEPLRQLVQYRQTGGNICGVNHPQTFRGRYRMLKKRRALNPKHIVYASTMPPKKQAADSVESLHANSPQYEMNKPFWRKVADQLQQFLRRK